MASKNCKLRIGHLSTFYHTSLILQGLDWIEDKLGLEADWYLFGSGPAIIEAFGRREIDIGYVGLPPVIIGMTKGIPIKCVAGGHLEGTVFLAKPDFKSLDELGSKSNVLRQFKDSVIGSPPAGSIHDVIIRGMLREEGLEECVSVKNYPWADFIVEALAEGEIDAAIGTPALAVAADRACGTRIMIPPHWLWPNSPSYGIITSTNLIKEAPDIVEGFLALHEEASNLIRTDPKTASKAVSEVVEIIDEDFVFETYRISPRYCAALSQGFIDASLAFAALLEKLKYISRLINAEELFDMSFVNTIHPEVPHY